jgi:hypothetical protein
MSYGNNDAPRTMHRAGDADGCKGGWVCMQCGKPIEELKFKPREGGENTLKCNDCFRSSRSDRR